MTQIVRPTNQPLTPSQRQWLHVRNYLREHRYELSVAAAGEYPGVARVADTFLLTASSWLLTEPVPLDLIELDFVLDAPFSGVMGTEPETETVRPIRPDGRRYPSYSAAVADLAAPALFENRGTYRLLDADLRGETPRLTFGRGTYFDGIDTGEAVGHEFAASTLSGEHVHTFRTAIGSPVDPTRRPVNIAISTLTIRRDRNGSGAHLLLHWRDPAKVGHAGGLYQVLPVGVFQPASDHPSNEGNDFSLWRCLVREFAEELLGEDEADGTHMPIDYAGWPFARRMSAGLREGSIHAYCLGLGVDPLTLATDLLTAVVIDAPVFDEVFGSLVPTNAEGELVGSDSLDSVPGIPFVESEVDRLIRREPMQAAGAAAIASAWRHRNLVLS